MPHDPDALPIGYYSVVIRKPAIASRFPGGLDGLRRQFGDGWQQNAALVVLIRMSMADIEQIVAELEAAEIRAGEDFAVGDMMLGQLLPCPGILFEAVGDGFMPSWTVKAGPPGETTPAPKAAAGPTYD